MNMRTTSLLAVLLSVTLAACVPDSKDVTSGGPAKSPDSSENEGSGENSDSETGDGSGTKPGNGSGNENGADPDPKPEPEPDPVEVPQAKVSFVSPLNGTGVRNPVRFTITAANVSTVQIEADQWPLSSSPWDPAGKTTLDYTFTGTGFERTVVLFGFDSEGREVASDTIRITVNAPVVAEPAPKPAKGTSLGSFINTYYYVKEEAEYNGAANSTFFDKTCKAIAKVPDDFAKLACIEGTAKLKDGRVLNYATNTKCGGPCTFTWAVMDDRFPWGQGNRANALVPLTSWAVDTSVIPNGTLLYVEEWDGKVIPKIGSVGGYTHDGCFRADDVGGGIKGKHVDMFSGSIAMYRSLNVSFPTRSSFTVYKDSPRCAHLKK